MNFHLSCCRSRGTAGAQVLRRPNEVQYIAVDAISDGALGVTQEE